VPLLSQLPGLLRRTLMRAPATVLRDQLRARLPVTPQASVSIVEPLSRREQTVLECIARGQSNQQISEALFISLHTVKSHARRINHKLGVARRTQAVAQGKML
jgi:LuxR family maltose regulon positive regulatory protein